MKVLLYSQKRSETKDLYYCGCGTFARSETLFTEPYPHPNFECQKLHLYDHEHNYIINKN